MDTFKRWTFGEVRVTRVLDLAPLVADPAMFLQTTKEAVLRNRDWLCPDYANDEGEITLHFQAFIIEARGKRIMVDPCVGNDKPRGHPLLAMRDSPFLERLASAGFPRESIDVVLCTHLHVDHCGWNTMLIDGKWVPTFPNARYLFAKAEFEHSQTDTGGDAPAIYEDSIKPIVEAGLAELVSPDHVIVEGIRLEPTPGHTPGHCSILISSKGCEALITGDVLHHPLQVALPHISSNFCWDVNMATRTRRIVLERVASRGAVMLGTHFAGPTGVYVKPDGDAWKVEEA
jgi:glyoxylase-like metal-dependent hydrolase (beta-lactamase superfamily II)